MISAVAPPSTHCDQSEERPLFQQAGPYCGQSWNEDAFRQPATMASIAA
jgi:hypothetical protein